jgi:hypothetical protein
MVGVPRVIRSCIDSFANDLIALAKEIAAEEFSRAMAVQQKETRRAEKEQRRADKLAARAERAELRRLAQERSKEEKAAARLERAEERRRQREARRLSLGYAPSETKRRSRRPDANGVAAPATPPPLFVHKRRRDGQIQALTRPADEPAAPAQTQPDAPAA